MVMKGDRKMEQERCPDGKHTPQVVETINHWKVMAWHSDEPYCAWHKKGHTVIYQCAVCGFKWSKERRFRSPLGGIIWDRDWTEI